MAVRSVPEPAAQLAPPPVSRGREELPPDPLPPERGADAQSMHPEPPAELAQELVVSAVEP
jgi:hypothetical protein